MSMTVTSARRALAQRPILSSRQIRPSLDLRILPHLQPIRTAVAALPALGSTVSSVQQWLNDIWEFVLRAVPKKKQSYARKRTRQLTGKALKDVEKVVPCSSCGRPKRPHVLCKHCVGLMKQMWEGAHETMRGVKKEAEEDDPPNIHEKYFKPESGGTWYSRFYPAQKTIDAPTEAPKRSMKKRYQPTPK